MRPLYSEAAKAELNNNGNTGLWYDKFFDNFQNDGSIKDGGKQDWIKTVTNGKCGNDDLLEQTQDRTIRLLQNAGGQPLFYELESDFVTGLGLQHPVENGFAWHHILGTPYLPGSSVKGLVRAWAEQWEQADKPTLKRIFGSESKKDKNFHVGSVIFLDALPTEPVSLKADIMTPHYSPYYQDETGETPPADWHSPNPIPFLVVEAGASFVFGILPRGEEDEADCKVARGWLKVALEWTGAGAKTAVGYGRFAEDTQAQQELEKRRKEELAWQQEREEEERRQQEMEEQTQGKSTLYAEIFRASIEGNWRNNKDAFSEPGVIESWLDRLEGDPQRDALGYLQEFIDLRFPKLLQDPEAKKGKKQRFAYSDRQRSIANRVLKLLEETQ